MKTRNLTYLGGLAALAVATVFLARQTDMDLTTDALAAGADSAMSVTCAEATSSAYTPGLSYTLTVASVSRTAAPFAASHTASSAFVTNTNVNGDTAPSVTTSSSGAADATKIVLYNTAPKNKVGGLQCSANTKGQMEVEGDAADSADFEVAFRPVGSTSYSSSHRVDTVSTGSHNMVFGASGFAGTATVSDSADSEGTNDGEVLFGPGATAASGGFVIANQIRYLGVNPDSLTETVNVSYTPGT